MSLLPLLKRHGPSSIIAWQSGIAIRQAEFLADVIALANRLPDMRHMINLCDDRYHFLVGLAAALLRKQVNLLPPSRADQVLLQISMDYANTYCLTDQHNISGDIPVIHYSGNSGNRLLTDAIPSIDSNQLAVIAFTSGSTGQPSPHLKTWGALVQGATLTARRFKLEQLQDGVIIGTVPHQHMYGLESTILLPAQSGMAMYSGRPFFPADVAMVLASLPAPRVLVTTPVHLRACVNAEIPLPGAAMIISATAPLTSALAEQAEQLMDAPVYEIYGSTETGAIASRRTIAGDTWQAYDTVSFIQNNSACQVSANHFSEIMTLNDTIHLQNKHEFILCGRSNDLINIAGKRVSLGDLNHKLNEIPGVIDGVFYMPEETDGRVTRLMAFVVAPEKSVEEIITQLKLLIDSAFIPRPLIRVESLNRNESGKIPKEQLNPLIRLATRAEPTLTKSRINEP